MLAGPSAAAPPRPRLPGWSRRGDGAASWPGPARSVNRSAARERAVRRRRRRIAVTAVVVLLRGGRAGDLDRAPQRGRRRPAWVGSVDYIGGAGPAVRPGHDCGGSPVTSPESSPRSAPETSDDSRPVPPSADAPRPTPPQPPVPAGRADASARASTGTPSRSAALRPPSRRARGSGAPGLARRRRAGAGGPRAGAGSPTTAPSSSAPPTASGRWGRCPTRPPTRRSPSS